MCVKGGSSLFSITDSESVSDEATYTYRADPLSSEVQLKIGNPSTLNTCSVQLSPAGPSGIQIFNPGIFGTGFCQIPGSRDFSGRDLPLFLIPGFFRNFSGIFRDFCFCFVCGSNHIIFTNLHHYHCHHHNRPHHHWPRPPFSFIALRKKRQNNCNKGFVCKQYFYQMQ